MANYKESTITGSKWVRCHSIVINNPLQINNASPTVSFFEQEIFNVGDDVVFKNITIPNGLCVGFDPSATIEAYNPITLEKTGTTFTHGELYTLLFSAYMDAAAKRDEAAAIVLETPGPIGNVAIP